MNEENKTGAFFDLDGTIVAPPSLEMRFAAHLALCGKLRASAVIRWLATAIKEGTRGLFISADACARLKAFDENKAYLAGVNQEMAQNWVTASLGDLELYPDALERLARHRSQGHAIFLVSGTLGPLARSIARRLAGDGEIGVAAIEPETLGEHWTGRTHGGAVCGAAKARAVRDLAAHHDIDLARSYAYGNSADDQWMLGAVAHATAVNPGALLTWLSRRHGWRIARWRRGATRSGFVAHDAQELFPPLGEL